MTTIKRAASFAAMGTMLIFSGVSLRAQDTKSSNIDSADRKFMMNAAQGGMAEVELGRLASQKASNSGVKDFGQKMVTDHSKANSELQTIAAQKGVTLPTDLDAKDRSEMDRLSKLSGESFDKAYMDYMAKDHRKDVSEFEKQVSSAKDPDVKNFASKTLPTLKEHLQMAEKLDGQLGGTSADRNK